MKSSVLACICALLLARPQLWQQLLASLSWSQVVAACGAKLRVCELPLSPCRFPVQTLSVEPFLPACVYCSPMKLHLEQGAKPLCPCRSSGCTCLAKLCASLTSAAHRLTMIPHLMQDPWAHLPGGDHVCQGA